MSTGLEEDLESLALQDKLHVFDIHTEHNLYPPLDNLPRLSDGVKDFLRGQGEEPETVLRRPALNKTSTDSTFPYADYFISSSHNTYLLSAQVLGKSSAEAYTHVLERGCRCVEIDVWPSSNGPVVNHGYTLSSSVPFVNVCRAIGAYIDRTYGSYKPAGSLYSKNYQPVYLGSSNKTARPTPPSRKATADSSILDFPVFISLECHVPPSGQLELVRIMREAFGARLVEGPLEGIDDDQVSPRDLRGRVVVMVEYYPPLGAQLLARTGTSGSADLDVGDDDGDSVSVKSKQKKEKKSWWKWGAKDADSDEDDDGAVSSEDEETRSFDDGGDDEGTLWPGRRGKRQDEEEDGERPKCDKIADELAALGYYARSLKPGKGWLGQTFTEPRHVLINISESACSRLLTAVAEHASGVHQHDDDHVPHEHRHSHVLHLPSPLASLVHHASYHLRRIYPKGTRISSTNLDPSQFWRTGSQVVSLNWQRYDRGMQMHEGLFVGTPGWVLKPSILRRSPEGYAPPAPAKIKLKGQIIGASSVPAPNRKQGKSFHTYLKVELYYHRDTTPSLFDRAKDKLAGEGEDVEIAGKTSLEEIKLKWRTKSIKVSHTPGRGADALWNESFELEYETDELAFIRLLIYEDELGKDDRVVSFCSPVDRLVTDQFVAVRMLNAKGKDVGATALVKFTLEKQN
ncbi:phospholipase C [Coprinopsis marcescibilis]|uniref:Phosphoinositide phospholipase C n=1 Tax=Coprinopsis marcescibilis TaxID=230819 RepID=A0A5C3KPB6_COPMA|nr:phospholipase C [Coprinopsis marcescibilis]